VVRAALVNLLNPNPYIYWSLVPGPGASWRGPLYLADLGFYQLILGIMGRL